MLHAGIVYIRRKSMCIPSYVMYNNFLYYVFELLQKKQATPLLLGHSHSIINTVTTAMKQYYLYQYKMSISGVVYLGTIYPTGRLAPGIICACLCVCACVTLSTTHSWVKAIVLWKPFSACKVTRPLQLFDLGFALFLYGETKISARHWAVVSAGTVTVWVVVKAEEGGEVLGALRVYQLLKAL